MPSSEGTDSPPLPLEDGKWLDEYFPLHRAVFHNDVQLLEQLLQAEDKATTIDRKDTHGNTALHIACMLGHRDCIKLLLNNGATLHIKNNLGWSSFHEAISYGDRNTIRVMLIEVKKQASKELKSRLPFLGQHFSKLGDFYMETKWEFYSWIPLLSRILPSDTFKIYKKGHHMRFDFTLIGFSDSGTLPLWERGNISLFLDMLATDGRKAVMVDHKKGVYQVLRDKNRNLNDELDLLMTSDITKTHMSTKPIHFVRAKTFFNWPKSEMVGGFRASLYHIKGMQLVTNKRREHLTKEDLERNQMMQKFFLSGELPKEPSTQSEHNSDSDDNSSRRSTSTDDSETDLIASLAPPSQPRLSWHQYLRVSDNQSHLGRPMLTKVSTKDLSGTLAMSTDFPLSLDVVLDIFSVMEPVNPTMAKLRKLCSVKIPRGFPVRIEMPIFATIQVRITFQRFEWRNRGVTPPFPDAMFQIPGHYREDPDRFKQI